ncbi:MAG: MBL fold metallo-hydrolase [Candidatus Rokubacteria bacterium]|nr:MBL fold metallo-hydrolase [Candidatus Rokubacteria bacterium]
MVFKQYYLGCLSQASYLIGDERTRTAVVVDPRRDVDEYLADAAAQGLRIAHVILTHFHADFVAGHLELRDRAGARIHLGARARAEYDFSPLADGDRLELGTVRLEALETPGHTPEGISLLVYDLTKDARAPQAVLTGDTLFIGDVGRPDLMASAGVSARDLAGMLYESVHTKLLRLPAETLVYPGHGAGSMCGKSLSSETVSTIEAQRRDNYALQPMGKDEFVRLITSDQPDAPEYFAYDAELNRRERPTLDRALDRELAPLSLAAVLAAQRDGAQVLDTRDPADFASGHLAGSINIGLGGRYATWGGILLSPERPILLVTAPGAERTSALRLGRIGFDNVRGVLAGGIEAAAVRPDVLRQTTRLTTAELRARLADGGLVLVDVRFESEFRRSTIPGSVNVPLHHLRDRLAEIPGAEPVLVYCQTGLRSSTAASVLEQSGRTDVLDLVGGIAAWELDAKSA